MKCPKCSAAVSLTPPTPALDPTASFEPQPQQDSADSSLQETNAGPSLAAASGEFPYLAPPQAADEIGRLGSYRVLARLGCGGMGTVFRAEDPHLKRQVALKVMLPQLAANATAVARFVREARSQAAVEHDHVAAIFQVGEERGAPYIAMPLLKGELLGDT